MSLSSLEVPGNVCKVIAHQARGLLYKGKDDSNNAFVTFTLSKNKFATSVLEKTQTPVWNEECEFVIADQGGTLELVVCHSDFLRERFLGRVEISLSGVAGSYGKSIRKWYKLQPKKGKEAKKLGDRGQLEVTVQILYRDDVALQQIKGQEKKPALLNILPSPAWRRKQSGSSPDTRRKDSRRESATEEYYHNNDINRELQFNDPAFYSDDSQSVASSMSDDFRTLHHHRQSQPDVVDQARDLRPPPPTPPNQKTSPSNRFRPGGVSGSARGKGGIGRNVKTALGNISKALSKEHIDKIGKSTPDLRYMSSSLPPTPEHQHDRQGDAGEDEPDSGFRNPGVHLGVSSLGGALLAPPSAINRAVSEESLLASKEKEEKGKGDVYSLTTMPRGKHARREHHRHRAKSDCFTLDELGHQAGSVTPDLRKKTPDSKENAKPRKDSSSSKYDTLSKQQLVHLVQQQESILSDNINQIKELETYIEKLLLRVMVESPQLLDMNRPIKF